MAESTGHDHVMETLSTDGLPCSPCFADASLKQEEFSSKYG